MSSLKVVQLKNSPNWYLRGTAGGQKIVESTGTRDRKTAEKICIKRNADLLNEQIHGKRATRTFADAAARYLTFQERTPSTKEYVRKLILHFGVTSLADIGQDSLDAAFQAILHGGLTASPATKIRAVITPLNAILEHAAVLGWCSRPSFKKPTIRKTSANFLLPAQADALITAATPHLRPLLTFLIGTGYRMSEALELDWSMVDLHGARVRAWQKQDNERRADLCVRVLTSLRALPHHEGAVFRPIVTRLAKGQKKTIVYGDAYRDNSAGGGQIRTAWATAIRKAGLSPDLTPHDLRHTWASWHACVHKDPFKLKQDGAWSSLAMVENYAHMMPEIYREEILAWRAGTAMELWRES